MAAAGWSSLPADLVRLISARLSSDADLLHTHQVCPHWRATTSLPIAWRPWILAGRAGRSGLLPIGEYSLRTPRGTQKMELGAPPAGFPYCCGTSKGWLALVDNDRSPTRLMVWEPLSKIEISLPCPRPLTQVYLSDDPLTSSNWFAIAGQLKGALGQKTLFWRPGDAEWTMLFERGTVEIDSMVFIEEKAYYMDKNYDIIICDLNTGAEPSFKCTPIYFVVSVAGRLCKCDKFHRVRAVHLVACNGEPLVVVLRHGRHPSLFEVYKPEWTPNRRVELRERVMDLGDYSLFLGRGDTFALSAKEFCSIKRNCIYYIERPGIKQYWISIFHLGSNFLEEIPYPEELKQDSINWQQYAWFCLRKPFFEKQ